MKTKEKFEKPYIVSIDSAQQIDKSFAKGLNFYKIVWIFLIGAIIGFIAETLFAFVETGQLVSRAGLVFGPFKPIYGFGAVVFTLLLYKIRKKNIFILFLLSSFIGAVFEIICSLFEEYVFGVEYWQYKGSFLNIDGRTNLFYSVCWGILGALFIKFVYPLISDLVEKIPNNVGIFLTWVIFMFLVIDLTLTGAASWRCVDRNYDVDPGNCVDVFLDKHYDDDYLSKLFPNMTIL